MGSNRIRDLRAIFLLLGAMLFACAAAWAQSSEPQASGGAGLRERHAALEVQLAQSAFKRPLVLESVEGTGSLRGDVYAVISRPFAAASAALRDPGQWCEVLILHLNTKYCRRTVDPTGNPELEVRIGKKHDQALSAATRVAFAFRQVRAGANYFAVELRAPTGPFDTRDYGILVEAVPLEAGRSFLHMGYSFGFGAMSRMAMQVYLSTLARDKVGFTIVAGEPSREEPQYVSGMRGLIERNTMRYYLAIDAYLDALEEPPAERLDKSLRDWFDATERYSRQLHELDRSDYLAMKHREYQRQQTAH